MFCPNEREKKARERKKKKRKREKFVLFFAFHQKIFASFFMAKKY